MRSSTRLERPSWITNISQNQGLARAGGNEADAADELDLLETRNEVMRAEAADLDCYLSFNHQLRQDCATATYQRFELLSQARRRQNRLHVCLQEDTTSSAPILRQLAETEYGSIMQTHTQLLEVIDDDLSDAHATFSVANEVAQWRLNESLERFTGTTQLQRQTWRILTCHAAAHLQMLNDLQEACAVLHSNLSQQQSATQACDDKPRDRD